MFCSECQAEYLPHVRRCPDCDVSLVEHLPSRGESEDESVSGVAVLKELAPIIAIPFVWVGVAILIGVYGKYYSFVTQIAVLLGYTYFVFLLVFCDTRHWKGFSLRNKTVQQKLPLLLCIHAGFVVVVFGGITGAMSVHSHLSPFWTLQRDSGGSSRFSNMSNFDLISVAACVAVLFTQILISRRILGRALKNEQTSGRS
jgi:hypothetical protein